jgi:hypothetical protein
LVEAETGRAQAVGALETTRRDLEAALATKRQPAKTSPRSVRLKSGG